MILLSIILILFFLHYSFLINKIASKIVIPPIRKSDLKKQNKFSIIIPFRNEEHHLKESILSLHELEYDEKYYEILFINDHSIDHFSKVFNEFASISNIHLIDSNGEGKKTAVETGISYAKFDWILSSDADCTYDKNWLNTCNDLINTKHSDLFVLPVYSQLGDSVLAKFQYYDSLSTLGINMGFYNWKNKVLLASGANLLYKKSKFEKANPFENNKNIHSGDDMFILQEFKKSKFNISVNFNEGLWVETKINPTWKKTIDQRIRWVKKMGSLKKNETFFFGLYFFLVQCVLITCLLAAFVFKYMWAVFLFLIALKAYYDTKLMRNTGRLNKLKVRFYELFYLEIIYMLMLPLLLIVSIFRNPNWKERKISS